MTGDAESLDAVRVPEKVLKFKSASGDIKMAELTGARGCVEDINVVEGWQTMISVGKYCAEMDCVIVLNSEGAYALPKGKGLAPIIQKYGVRVAQRDAEKGGLYRCTPMVFAFGVSGGDHGCASEDAVAGDDKTKVGAACVHEEVEIKVGAVPAYGDVETKVGDEHVLGDDEIEDGDEVMVDDEENKNAQVEAQKERELETWVGGDNTRPAIEDECDPANCLALGNGHVDPEEHQMLVEEFLEAMEMGRAGEIGFWYEIVWEFDIVTLQETMQLVRMGDDPETAVAEVLYHTPPHMRPKVFQDPVGDQCRMEEEKVMYAIEVMEGKKTTGTTAAVVLVELEAKSQEQGIQMIFQIESGGDDVALENEMPERSGPDLPERQGGAG